MEYQPHKRFKSKCDQLVTDKSKQLLILEKNRIVRATFVNVYFWDKEFIILKLLGTKETIEIPADQFINCFEECDNDE